jgi:hypothetical protein
MGKRTSLKPQRRAARLRKCVARRRGGCAGCCVDRAERAQDCAGYSGAPAALGWTGKDTGPHRGRGQVANRARRAMPAALAACSRALRANSAAMELVGHGARASRRAAHARGALSRVDRKEKPAEREKKRGSDSPRALDDGRRCCESA